MSPASRRSAISHLREAHKLSERRAYRLVGLSRLVARHRPPRTDPDDLRVHLKKLAMERLRFGNRRLHVLLRRDGFAVNRRRVHRNYRGEALQVRNRKRRKYAASTLRQALAAPSRPHERLSMNFFHDSLSDGRSFRTLNVVDDFTRLSVAMEVDLSLGGESVGQALDQAAAKHCWPKTIVDNGPDFTSKHSTSGPRTGA